MPSFLLSISSCIDLNASFRSSTVLLFQSARNLIFLLDIPTASAAAAPASPNLNTPPRLSNISREPFAANSIISKETSSPFFNLGPNSLRPGIVKDSLALTSVQAPPVNFAKIPACWVVSANLPITMATFSVFSIVLCVVSASANFLFRNSTFPSLSAASASSLKTFSFLPNSYM